MRGKVDHGDSVHMQKKERGNLGKQGKIKKQAMTSWEQEKMGSMLEVAVLLALKFSVSGVIAPLKDKPTSFEINSC